MNEEIWKDIKGWEGRYQISNKGHVRSLVEGKGNKLVVRKEPMIRKAFKNPTGYPMVILSKLSFGTTYAVHRLVIETFVGPAPKNHECAHLDGNRANPELSNLKWTTKKENHAHKKIHGTDSAGMRNCGAKLTDEKVLEMRRLRKLGWKNSKIAELFGVTTPTASRIVGGRAWLHLPL